jgi:hypothetical protein
MVLNARRSQTNPPGFGDLVKTGERGVEWPRVERREVDGDGCALARPDRHVAWRYQRFDGALHAALEQVLAQQHECTPVAFVPTSTPQTAGLRDARRRHHR